MSFQQKTKNFPVPVSGSFPSPFEDIKLKIIASPNAWNGLYFMCLMNPEYVGNFICRHFAKPAFDRINTKPSRGIHKDRDREFIENMKEWAPLLYYAIKQWMKEPKERWPKGLKREVEEIKKQSTLFGRRRSEPNALEITAHVMEKRFGRERRKQGLEKWTDHLDTFRVAFISKSKFKGFAKQKVEALFKTITPS